MKTPLLLLSWLLSLSAAAQDHVTYVFKGAIDSVYFYHGELVLKNDMTLTGKYQYDNHNKWIPLEGVIKPDGAWQISELVTLNGKPTPNSLFEGKMDKNRVLAGTWHKFENGAKVLPFYFTPSQNFNARTVPCSRPTIFSTNKSQYPVITHRTYMLTSEMEQGMGSVLWFDLPYKNHFSIDFDFMNARSRRWSAHPDETADGMCLSLFKEKTAYVKGVPVGGAKTFIADGTGLGVYFNLYMQRKVQLIDGNGRDLCAQEAETFTDNSWYHATVTVDGTKLSVTIEGEVVLQCTISPAFVSGSGFGLVRLQEMLWQPRASKTFP